MKKIGISFLIVAIIILTGLGLTTYSGAENKEYLRIHIRANSNMNEDQEVKYQVKSAVVSYLTPYIAECKTKKMAEEMLKTKKADIENVCDKVLEKNNFSYKSHAEVRNEQFPTRVYNGLELQSGYYDALIIELGSGRGDNWWCVVYPPLCFTKGNMNYVYKSKIFEIIEDFKKRR